MTSRFSRRRNTNKDKLAKENLTKNSAIRKTSFSKIMSQSLEDNEQDKNAHLDNLSDTIEENVEENQARENKSNKNNYSLDKDLEFFEDQYDGLNDQKNSYQNDKLGKQSIAQDISQKRQEQTIEPVVDESITSISPDMFWRLWNLSPSHDKGWKEYACPKCTKDAKDIEIKPLLVNSLGWFLCFNCGFNGNGATKPATYRDNWLSVFRHFLQDESFDKELPDNFKNLQGIEGCWAPCWIENTWRDLFYIWCKNDKNKISDAWVYLDVEKKDGEYINLNDNDISKGQESWKRFKWTIPTPLAWDNVLGSRAVLVHHVSDMQALQLSGIKNVACLPPDMNSQLSTAPVWKVLEVIEAKMKDLESVVIAFRSTLEDRALEEELGRRIDRERCFRTRWRPDRDDVYEEEEGPVDVLRVYGEEQLEIMVEAAPPFPVVGVYELSDIEDRFDNLYETGLAPGVSTDWPTMDQYYTVKTGQWTLVTGIPGHGKSSWLDGLMVNLAKKHGWRFGIFSPENQPVERHFASLLEKTVGKPFSDGPTPRISIEEKNKYKRWLGDKFKIILPDEEDGVWTLDAVLRLAKVLVYRYGIRGLVIDPWNEIDHVRSGNINETTQISESLTKIRRFARLYDVHIWIVAHPTKLNKKDDGKYPVPTPYDVSGGAHWRNKADNAITVYRNVDEDDYDVCDIHIQKIRFKEVGRVGVVSLRCDTVSGCYVDDIDQNKRAYALSNGHYNSSTTMRIPAARKYNDDSEPLEYEVDDPF